MRIRETTVSRGFCPSKLVAESRISMKRFIVKRIFWVSSGLAADEVGGVT